MSTKNETHPEDVENNKGVIIIGAGAAGLTAAYDLQRKGIPVTILEAHSSLMGGRLRKLEGFADFPIDLGGEWLHTSHKILETIVDDPNVTLQVQTRPYIVNPYRDWVDGEWEKIQWDSYNRRFVRYTWFDFFHDYICRPVEEKILYGCIVSGIDYSANNTVKVECRNGRTFYGAQVLVTVSLKILQDGDIRFTPSLPAAKMKAIENAPFEPGMKVFIEFTEQFYFKGFGLQDPDTHGEMYFWDETYLQDSDRHIMGVFLYGERARKYVELDDEDVLKVILKDLDVAFDGRASETYVKHFVQNWTKNEPHVRGLYSSYRHGLKPLYTIMQPVDNKVFFAGEALPMNGADYGYAHGAALSGRRAATSIECVRQGKKPPFQWTAFAVHILSILCCGLEHRLFFYESDD